MKRTIQKVLNELKSDKPDLSYIRGLLEGLVEEEELVSFDPAIPAMMNFGKGGVLSKKDAEEVSNYIKPDEEEIPAHLKPGRIGNIA